MSTTRTTMNVLILTANTGGGHNAAAAAIADACAARGISCTIENALQFVPKPIEDTIVNTHRLASKYLPKPYGLSYELTEQTPDNRPVYLAFAPFAPILRNFITQHGFDTVICVHVFAALMMTAIRRNWPLDVKQYFVATDYTCSPSVEETEVDAMFVPRGAGVEFSLAGVDPAVLRETGIPVKRACYEPLTKTRARELVYTEMAVEAEDRLVLVAPQCLSVDDVKRLAEAVCAREPKTKFVVICGKGENAMKRRLLKLENPAIKVLGFTKRMIMWMKAADVLVTKPGGLTTTEAVSCGVPVVLLEWVPGLETHNRNWMVNRGCACAANGVPALCVDVLRLLQPEVAAAMTAAQAAHFGESAVDALLDEVLAQDEARTAEAARLEEREREAEIDL